MIQNIFRRVTIVSVVLIAAGLAACSTPTPTPTAEIIPLMGVGSPIVTPMHWGSPPLMTIDKNKFYIATLHTAKGDIRIQLFADKAPKTVNNFVFLAHQGFYDNGTFFRVLEGFMAQAGDPTGTGQGGPGYTFEDEIAPDLKYDQPGLLGMANSGPNTNGSQFFITFAAAPWLDGNYTQFGKVISGLDVLLSIRLRDPQGSPAPDFLGDALNSITISESPMSLLPTSTPTATLNPPKLPTGSPPMSTFEPTARADRYTAPPDMVIDLTDSYSAVLQTTKGKIVVALYAADAPKSVNNFIVLSKIGYYDNFPFTLVETGKFVATGGSLAFDIGYTLPLEIRRPNEAGAVGCFVQAGKTESSGSIFYILLREDKSLDGKFTVFGKVVQGLEVSSTLTAQDRIESIEIIDISVTKTAGP